MDWREILILFPRYLPILVGLGLPLKLTARAALGGLFLSTTNASVEVSKVRLTVDGAVDFEAAAPG